MKRSIGVSAAQGLQRLLRLLPSVFSPLAFREGCSHPLPEAGLRKATH